MGTDYVGPCPSSRRPPPWSFPATRRGSTTRRRPGRDRAPTWRRARCWRPTGAGCSRCRPATRGDPMCWFSPVRRGRAARSTALRGVAVAAPLRCGDFEIRVDTAFEEVLDACADPRRDSGWIDADIRAAYLRLHELGWAHSVEAWRDGRLAGGLYGVAIGGLFAGESMFHRERDASKVALVGLVRAARDDQPADRLLDVQWRTPHLASLGVVEIPRAEYLAPAAGAARGCRRAGVRRDPGVTVEWATGCAVTTTHQRRHHMKHALIAASLVLVAGHAPAAAAATRGGDADGHRDAAPAEDVLRRLRRPATPTLAELGADAEDGRRRGHQGVRPTTSTRSARPRTSRTDARDGLRAHRRDDRRTLDDDATPGGPREADRRRSARTSRSRRSRARFDDVPRTEAPSAPGERRVRAAARASRVRVTSSDDVGGRPVVADHRPPGAGPLDHPAVEVDDVVPLLGEVGRPPARSGRRPCRPRRSVRRGPRRAAGRAPSAGCGRRPRCGRASHSTGSRTSRTLTPSGSGFGTPSMVTVGIVHGSPHLSSFT